MFYIVRHKSVVHNTILNSAVNIVFYAVSCWYFCSLLDYYSITLRSYDAVLRRSPFIFNGTISRIARLVRHWYDFSTRKKFFWIFFPTMSLLYLTVTRDSICICDFWRARQINIMYAYITSKRCLYLHSNLTFPEYFHIVSYGFQWQFIRRRDH